MAKNNKNTVKVTQKKKRRVTRRMKRARRATRRRQMGAAEVGNFDRQFNVLDKTGTTVTVAGRDLVYSVPTQLADTNTPIIAVIPANPAYWAGTRVAALAQGYQTYRPLQFKISYVPQCAVTQEGNVIGGTLWNDAPSEQSLQQSLRTSNGGLMIQCYSKKTTTVTLRSNLQYNLYRMGGQFDQESNPFIFMAMTVGCTKTVEGVTTNVVPGYFYVSWKYTFKNPIGESIVYGNSGLTNFDDPLVDTSAKNVSMVYIAKYDEDTGKYVSNPEIVTGSVIQVEKYYDPITEGIGIDTKQNGSSVIVGPNDLVWAYTNTTMAAANRAAVERYKSLNIKAIDYDHVVTEESITVAVRAYSFRTTNGDIISRVSISSSFTATLSQNMLYGLPGDSPNPRNQDFGTVQGSNGTYIEFKASHKDYMLYILEADKKGNSKTRFTAIAKPVQVTVEDNIDTELKQKLSNIVIDQEKLDKQYPSGEAQENIINTC